MEKIKIHIHIPKCGGKSMVQMFQKKYKTLCVYATWQPDLYIFSENEDDLFRLLAEDNGVPITEAFQYAKDNKFEAIIGNLAIPLIDAPARLFWNEIEYSAFLRQPFDRAFSERCHDTKYHSVPIDDIGFYSRKANSMSRQIGCLENLSFVGDFDTFSDDIQRLGLEEVHTNASGGVRELVREDAEIERCNQLDLILYQKMKQTK